MTIEFIDESRIRAGGVSQISLVHRAFRGVRMLPCTGKSFPRKGLRGSVPVIARSRRALASPAGRRRRSRRESTLRDSARVFPAV